MPLILTIHRSAEEIGGNCIELRVGDERLLLDIGRPLTDETRDMTAHELLPKSLDLSSPVAGVVISHPHQDHWGLVSAAPTDWPIYCGQMTESLIRLTGKITRNPVTRKFQHYESARPFEIGSFRLTPMLTDHSAPDAHMLLIETAGKRVLYTGDFRMNGRKGALVERLIQNPPADIDILLMEGTTLGRTGGYPTESELEDRFADLFRRARGRVFVSWSAQNLDRTVTLYRACKKTDRTLVVDLYTADAMQQLARHSDRLPAPGWPGLKVVCTGSMLWLYKDQLGEESFLESIPGNAQLKAQTLEKDPGRWVVMLRPPLMRDFKRAGIRLTPDDAWSFSQWSGYLKEPATQEMQLWFTDAGARIEHIHTSGHAAPDDLKRFATAMNAKHFVPIHSFEWDEHMGEFENVERLKDGEEWTHG